MAIPTRKGTTYSEPQKKKEAERPKSSGAAKKVKLDVSSAVGTIRKGAARARDI